MPTDRVLNALPDTLDFRDQLYVPTLVRVPRVSDIDGFRAKAIPVLDQGREGACTGFGLATVANYLLRVRGEEPDADEVSAWMLYTMAKRYDEWPGDNYDGSSARGAMKGWHKHGLCALTLWKDGKAETSLSEARAADAIKRPLGAYFRVNHKDLVAMHSAISEVGVLYATASVHKGWQEVKKGDREIVFQEGTIGGHAFAIVGYDREGFWIQNSWGPKWGSGGLALLSYADWLANGNDVWVAALGAPVHFSRPLASAEMRAGAPRSYESQIYASLRPHIVTCRNDGILDDKGIYGLSEAALKDIVSRQMVTQIAAWKTKRVLLYAHGGLVSQDSAIQTVANNRDALLAAQVYPISFVWRSDAWTSLGNILREAISRRRDEGVLDKAKDFMLDRLDDTLEPLARLLGGKALWDEMKENAQGATAKAKGGARLVADQLVALRKAGKIDEIHLVGHSAGSIFHAPLAEYLVAAGAPIDSLTLLAPACTMELFEKSYRPLIAKGKIARFNLYLLDDATERDDDCKNIYHKSLLYLVRNAFEKTASIFGIGGGVPLLGLEKDAKVIPADFWAAKGRKLHVAPGPTSGARHHGDFDDDPQTLKSALAAIVGNTGTKTAAKAGFVARSSRADLASKRTRLDQALLR